MNIVSRSPHSWGWIFTIVVLFTAVVTVGLLSHDALWTTCAAALATMIVIGGQSREIARSTSVAERSVLISQASAIEAEKTRLDQRVAGVSIRVSVADAGPQWPPVRKRQWHGEPFNQVPHDVVFRLPGARNEQFGLYAHVFVQIDSSDESGHRKVLLRGFCMPLDARPGVGDLWTEPCDSVQTIWNDPQGGPTRLVVHGTFSVGQWIENAQALRDGRPLPHKVTAQIVYPDGYDNGITDIWDIDIAGSVIEPVPDETDSWQIKNVATAAEAGASAVVFPRVRTYWRSKRDVIELP